MNYSEDAKLDINQLDKEWEKQSNIIQEYTEKLSGLNKNMSSLTSLIDFKESKLKMEYRKGIRKVMDDKGKSIKLTVDALNELVTLDEEIQELRQKEIDLKYNIDILKGVIDALKTKTKAMEWECQLFLTGYFGQPKDQRSLLKNKNK